MTNTESVLSKTGKKPISVFIETFDVYNSDFTADHEVLDFWFHGRDIRALTFGAHSLPRIADARGVWTLLMDLRFLENTENRFRRGLAAQKSPPGSSYAGDQGGVPVQSATQMRPLFPGGMLNFVWSPIAGRQFDDSTFHFSASEGLDTDMNHSTRRLWGIDLIAAIYGLATLALFWLCFAGTEAGRLFGMILAPVCATLCLGIAFRVNMVRVALMILLGMALIGDALLIVFFVGQLAGAFQVTANQDPVSELIRIPVRSGATLAMFFYLKRPDVRDAFRRRK